MKRIIIILIVSLTALSLLPALEWTPKMSRNIVVQGNYGKSVKVRFDRIATQSSSFSIGMPFDIEGRLVQYNTTEKGREIAYWSVIANTKFTMKITAEKLTSERKYETNSDPAEANYMLDYIMTFTYDFGFISSGTQTDKSGSFIINTESSSEWLTYVNEYNVKTTLPYSDGGVEFNIIPNNADASSVIGSVNGSVYFMFTAKATEYISNGFKNAGGVDMEVPSGNYYANVTLTIITEGE